MNEAGNEGKTKMAFWAIIVVNKIEQRTKESGCFEQHNHSQFSPHPPPKKKTHPLNPNSSLPQTAPTTSPSITHTPQTSAHTPNPPYTQTRQDKTRQTNKTLHEFDSNQNILYHHQYLMCQTKKKTSLSIGLPFSFKISNVRIFGNTIIKQA